MKARVPWKTFWLVPLTMFALSCSCARKPEVAEQTQQKASTTSPMSGSWGIDLAKLPGTRFQATLQDGVVRIDADTVKRTARGVNKNHDIYFFDNVPELR